MSAAGEIRETLAEKGTASILEIANVLGIDQQSQEYHRISQALVAGVKNGWAERVGRGQYAYLNGSKPAKAETPDELRSLVDSLVPAIVGVNDPFAAVGLTYLTRTQSGAFVCTDQHGVAWQVEVTATARLL